MSIHEICSLGSSWVTQELGGGQERCPCGPKSLRNTDWIKSVDFFVAGLLYNFFRAASTIQRLHWFLRFQARIHIPGAPTYSVMTPPPASTTIAVLIWILLLYLFNFWAEKKISEVRDDICNSPWSPGAGAWLHTPSHWCPGRSHWR